MGAWGLALAAVLLWGCVDLRRPVLVTLVDGSPPTDAIAVKVDTGATDADHDASVDPDGPDEPDGPGDPADAEPDGPDPLPDGSRCDRAGQCASGFCAQGVCCNDACQGTCSACNLATSPGTCAQVPAGEDPGQSCADEPLVSCGLDGTCDGRGGCRRRAAGIECRPGELHRRPGVCGDHLRRQRDPCPEQTAGTACTSGMCTGSSCAAPCAGDGQCQSGFFCNAGRCTAKLAAGGPATAPPSARAGSAWTASAAPAPAPRPASPATTPARRAPAAPWPADRIRAGAARPRRPAPAGGPAAATAAAPAACTR